MRRGHRTAHVFAVTAAAAATGALLAYGWIARASLPTPLPAPSVLSTGERPEGAAWEAVIETPAGAALVAFYDGHIGTGRGVAAVDEVGAPIRGAPSDHARLWVSLPPNLDAAEPALILETRSAPPRVLGSVTTGPPWIPAPDGLPAGGRLVLADLARSLRIGETAVPAPSSASAVDPPGEASPSRRAGVEPR